MSTQKLPSLTSLCLPYKRPVNPRDEMLRQGWQRNGRLMSQNKHLVGVWHPDFYGSEMGWAGEGVCVRKQVKRHLIFQVSPRMASLRQGNMLISSSLQSTDCQFPEQRKFSLTVGQRGRILWGRPLCVIIITKMPPKQIYHRRVKIGSSQLHKHRDRLTFNQHL